MEHPKHIKDFITANTRTTTKLNLTPVKGMPDIDSIPAAGSRIGGPAFVSDTWPWPVDPEDYDMLHLAQLNFAELPPREGYPTDGLLQFFLANDGAYGINLENVPDNLMNPKHRLVRYIPAADLADGHAEGNLDTQADSISRGFFTVTGTLMHQIPNAHDEAIAVAEEAGFDWWEYYEEFMYDEYDNEPSSLFGGGWAWFAQDDIRENPAEMQLLLEIDENGDRFDGPRIDWGDGVANFFISPADLAALNFDNVLYIWDC